MKKMREKIWGENMEEKKDKKQKKIENRVVKIREKNIKELVKSIEEISKNMISQIRQGKSPVFKTLLRGKGNVFYDEKIGYLQLRERYNFRRFLNIAHARKFMQTTLVMEKAYEYLNEGKTAALREIYYELKHTLPKSKENTFEEQRESDNVLTDLEHGLLTIREKLNVHADAKGSLYGDITMQDVKHNNDIFNAAKIGRGGWSIMSHVEPEEIKIKKINADYLLVVETGAMYERLVEENFPKKNRAILVGTGGQPSRGTRRLIHRIHYEHKLPVYVFTDGDPYGWYIYSVIKFGSMELAAHSYYLGVPDAKFVGMTMRDVEKYKLQNVTEKLKDTDIKRIKELMQYPWMQSKEWQAELKTALDKKIRIEQQALANKSLSFVAEEYLPKKIKAREFLP